MMMMMMLLATSELLAIIYKAGQSKKMALQ